MANLIKSPEGNDYKRRPPEATALTRSGAVWSSGSASGESWNGARAGASWGNRAAEKLQDAAKTAAGSVYKSAAEDPYKTAFGLLYLFTLLLYVRPNDLFPVMGTFPLAKIVALLVPLAYISAQQRLGKPIIKWTLEVKMVFVILMMAILLTPIAASPKDSFDMLSDIYIKTVAIFILMISIVNTRDRLRSILKLVVLCGTWLAFAAIKNYADGNLTMNGMRIQGIIGGIFGNPNDLAAALDLLIPLAVTLALTSHGGARVFYLFCTAIMTVGVIVTFSRGGFLGLITLAFAMMWKLGRGRRIKMTAITAVIVAIFLLATPGGYRNRIVSIFDHEQDKVGSAQERSDLLKRGVEIAISRPIAGVGMGNFHIYSLRELEAHNAYVELAAELGMIGFLAYLILILAPLRSLNRIDRATRNASDPRTRELRYFTIGIQSVLIAYIVVSFFASIQYLWYLYYSAGYAIALRQIYSEEASAAANSVVALTSPIKNQSLGVIWPKALPPAEIAPSGGETPNAKGILWSNGRSH